jgi:hypothetical protein
VDGERRQGRRLPLPPDITEGRIYTASVDGVVTVLDESGKTLARHETKKKLSGGVRVGGDKIVVGTAKGEIIALGMDGKTAWTTPLAGEVIAPAAISRNTVAAAPPTGASSASRSRTASASGCTNGRRRRCCCAPRRACSRSATTSWRAIPTASSSPSTWTTASSPGK